MAHSFSAEERIAALFTIQARMLHMLWLHVLSGSKEPIEEAEAVESLMVADLEEMAAGLPDREAAQIQQLYIEPVEDMWAKITAALAENDQPIPYTPTAYGYRLWDQLRRQGPTRTPDSEPEE